MTGLAVFRTRWERRIWFGRKWVFTISLSRAEDAK